MPTVQHLTNCIIFLYWSILLCCVDLYYMKHLVFYTCSVISVALLPLTRDLPGTHFCKTDTARNHPHQTIGYLGESQNTSNKLLIYKTILKPLDLRNTTLGYGFHLQHRNSRIESLAHDSGRTLVCAEYDYLKGSPNTNS
jgi:hypothetical protein